MFAELSSSHTAMGLLSLRRRRDPSRGVDLYEVKLGEEYLMSSLFTVAEIELARLGLERCDGAALDVVVGGLGLGYTAQAVLHDPRVTSMLVIEALPAVIDWHEQDLLPDTSGIAGDPRTRFVLGDFFARVRGGQGLDPQDPTRRFHAILVDIDHTPAHVLDPSHADLYTREGLARLARQLHAGGVFGLWSDDPPDDAFLEVMRDVFDDVGAEVVTFPNPNTGGESANTVYLASTMPVDGPHRRRSGS